MSANNVQEVVCESLNINAILNARSTQTTQSEIAVLSICGGKNDIFTKTVLDWLRKTRNLSIINLLLCGANKNVDPCLAKMRKLETKPEELSKMVTRKKKDINLETKIYMKHQNNLPTEAQWQILQPEIVVVGLHCLSERWCAKNSTDDLLFPINDKATGNNYETAFQLSNDNLGAESDDEKQSDASDEDSQDAVGQKRKQKICVEHSRRPTLFRTDVYRRLMLLHILSLVALYRPKIIFIQNITEPSKQAERRRKEELLWSLMINIMQRFGVECAYRVRAMGLELREEMTEDFPTDDVWCNGVFLERIDNEPNVTSLHHEMCLYEKPQFIADIQDATRWIFYDHEKANCSTFDQMFDVKKSLYYFASREECGSKRIADRNKRRKRSVTLPVSYCFPSSFAKALAHYAVAQTIETL